MFVPPPKTTIIIDLHFIECPKGRQTDRRTERRCVIQVTIFPFPKWGGGGNATEAVMQSYAIESNTLEIDSIRSNEYCSFVCSLEWHALNNMYVCVCACMCVRNNFKVQRSAWLQFGFRVAFLTAFENSPTRICA